jgi:hypothetical protein
MTRHTKFVLFFVATLTIVMAFSLAASAQTGSSMQNSDGSTVAYVYVSGGTPSNSEIYAYYAASDGKLTSVSGSPFPAFANQGIAVNEKYLFGTDGVYIYSFAIASDGAIKQVASINAQQFNENNCGGPINLFLDHTGGTLYDEDYDSDCANNTYQFFSIDDSTGALGYLGIVNGGSPMFNVPLSFIGNNVYAYGSYCYHFTPAIFAFRRHSDGTLTSVKDNPPLPIPPKGDFYCPYMAAADSANHVAISVLTQQPNMKPDGSPQLATYTADASGKLTTKSAFWNMPNTDVGYVTDILMSPSGKLLALGGAAGLQVFHFNGSKPITHYTKPLTTDRIDQVFWDNDNHLYAISRSAGKLFVFTITPTSVRQAAGSPYMIPNPQSVTVLSKKYARVIGTGIGPDCKLPDSLVATGDFLPDRRGSREIRQQAEPGAVCELPIAQHSCELRSVERG